MAFDIDRWSGGGNVWRAARRGASLLGFAALALAAVAGVARAADEDCMMCHEDRSLTRSGPKASSVWVDAGAVRASAHAKLACDDCHKGVSDPPHAEDLPEVKCVRCHGAQADTLAAGIHGRAAGSVEASCRKCHGVHDVKPAKKAGTASCMSCHSRETEEYRESIHGVALAGGDPEASTCTDCHGSTHAVKSHLDPTSGTNHANLARTCARCHADRELVARRRITIPQAVQLFDNSVHGRSKDARAATCSDCHESHRMRRAADPASSIYRTNIPTTCGKCHGAVAKQYRTGVHGVALRRGVTASPVCTDCHGEHLIRGPHDRTSPVAGANVTQTCSRCHAAEGIRETFGLPAGRLSTYEDSFHGLAARGGSPVVANCASCHGYHEILPSTDPRSEVSPQRLAETCGKCHPGAGANFAMGPVHEAMTNANQPVLYWARIIYLWLIGGTIGFMLLHQALDFGRKIGRHLRAQSGAGHFHHELPTRWFERMTVAERIQHVLLAVSFFTLVYTGFALKFPEAWLFAWFARLEGGYEWRSVVHRVAGVAMIAVSLYHVAYLFTRRGRGLVFDLMPRIKDGFDLAHNMLYLFGLRKSPPAFERFGYIEKAEYWALIWGTVVMSVTGIVLWFETEALRYMSKWMLDLATVVHYYEAWLAFLAIVVWHLYQNIVNPDVYPMNWTWLTGRISDTQLKHEHYLEWSAIVASERDPEPGQGEGDQGVAKGNTPAQETARGPEQA